MKKELFHLAVKSIKRRRKSSILMFCILALSISFAVIALSVNESMNKSNEEYRYDTYGTWEGALLGGKKDDLEILKKEKTIAAVGTAVCFGTVGEDAGYGAIENELKKMGRLRLLEGDFPQEKNEIALEADVLSELKHNYEIGQKINLEISFPAVSQDGIETTVVVSREYTLCGVLKEYTDLWCVDNEILPGAVVTDEEAFQVIETAKAENTDAVIKEPKYHYFFQSHKDREKMLETVRQLISSDMEAKENRGKIAVNTYAHEMATQGAFDSFYVVMIFITTLLAVLCIYMVQMQKQIRQTALLRSIGITKRQLRMMLFFETLCLTTPAMLAGILIGSAGTWLAIKGLIRVSTQKVYVTIPFAALVGIFLLWVLGIFVIRTIILWMALRQPLTGKMKYSGKRIRMYRKWKYSLCIFIAVVGCLVLFAGVLCSYELLSEKREAEKIPAYRFMTGMEEETKIEENILEKMLNIPGINHIRAWGFETADMKFQESGNCPLVKDLKENYPIVKDRSRENSDGLGVVLYGIREENWEEYIDFEKLGVNRENFRKGLEVILLFPVNAYDEIVVEDRTYTNTGILKGQQIAFDFYGRKIDRETGTLESTEEKIGEYTTKVSAIKKVKGEKDTLQFMAATPYNVVCSAEALKTMLEGLPDNYMLSNYETGLPFGYAQGEIFASSEAGYFSTDYVMADLCSRYGISMDSYREENFARIQEIVQRLIQLCFGGVSVFIIALLLIWNILSLAGEEEKNKIGILRAIGMSKKQQKKKILGETIVVGMLSVTGGWGFFGIYLLLTAWYNQQRIWVNFHEKQTILDILKMRIESFFLSGVHTGVIVGITLLGFGLIAAVYYGTKKKLLKEDILAFIREED